MTDRREQSRRSLLLLAVACCVWCSMLTLSAGAATTAPSEAGVACATSQVHYKPLVGGDHRFSGLPWVQSSPETAAVVGYLFYYGAPTPWGPQKTRRFMIYSGGRSPDDKRNTKILWRAGERDGERMVVTGHRQGSTKTFRQVLSVGPSVLRVPSPGCWSLTLAVGGSRSRLTVLSIPGPR